MPLPALKATHISEYRAKISPHFGKARALPSGAVIPLSANPGKLANSKSSSGTRDGHLKKAYFIPANNGPSL